MYCVFVNYFIHNKILNLLLYFKASNGAFFNPSGSVSNERFSVRPMIHHEQDGPRQHSVYIPKHDISITVRAI
jgi:hypothetical protein